MITHKEHIIKYFESGIKDVKNFKIGIEHEKFLFDEKTNKRVDYPTILKMFSLLSEFWLEANNGKKEKYYWITETRKKVLLLNLEIKLSYQVIKLNNIHESMC